MNETFDSSSNEAKLLMSNVASCFILPKPSPKTRCFKFWFNSKNEFTFVALVKSNPDISSHSNAVHIENTHA